MKLEYYISGGALLVSIIFGVYTIIISHKANRLQNEVLELSKKADDFEIKKGEVLLISFIGRYFIAQLDCWEQSGKMRSDKLSVRKYTNELNQLSNDINSLSSNPFYIAILEKYPEMNLVFISLRYSVIERGNTETMAVDPLLFEGFFDLYNKIKVEIDDKELLKNQYYKTMDEAASFLKREIPKLDGTSK
jgi:hypothetical protein